MKNLIRSLLGLLFVLLGAACSKFVECKEAKTLTDCSKENFAPGAWKCFWEPSAGNGKGKCLRLDGKIMYD